MPCIYLSLQVHSNIAPVSRDWKSVATNDELGVKERIGAEITNRSDGHNGEEAQLCETGTRKSCEISDVGPSCQSSPESIRHSPECETIAIIGMGMHPRTQTSVSGADISQRLPVARWCFLPLEALGPPHRRSFWVL